jgi:hypothetical protein
MTRNDEFIGQLEAYLHDFEGTTPMPDVVRDAVRAELPTTKQIGLIWPIRRFPIMNSNIVRFGIAAVAVVVAVILSINFLSRPNVGSDPEPTATPTGTPEAAATPSSLPAGEQQLSGRYSLGTSFPVGINFEVPEGWLSCSAGQLDQCVYREGETPIGVGFLIVENVVADPCGSPSELLDPPVGPSVDDLVTAISNLEGFVATAATDLTVDGFHGKEFTVTAPAEAGCGATWATEHRTNGVGPGEINLMRILDVDGVRVVITAAHSPEASEEQLSALNSVIASIQIEP